MRWSGSRHLSSGAEMQKSPPSRSLYQQQAISHICVGFKWVHSPLMNMEFPSFWDESVFPRNNGGTFRPSVLLMRNSCEGYYSPQRKKERPESVDKICISTEPAGKRRIRQDFFQPSKNVKYKRECRHTLDTEAKFGSRRRFFFGRLFRCADSGKSPRYFADSPT